MADQSRLEIAIDSRGAERNVRNVRSELGKLERAGGTAARAADDVGQSFEDVARSAGIYRDASGKLREANGRFATSARIAEIRARSLGGELTGASGGFRSIARSSQLAVPPVSQLTSLLGSLTGVLGAREVIRYADTWQNAANQLRQVTDSAGELERTQASLMRVANETRSAFEPTANLYSRLARSTTELGLSQDDLIGLTRTINQSFAVSGATAEEAAAAITQLSQGLAAGALRGDEFNSVSEQAPGIMRAIAEELDMTIGELRAFAAEGGITAEIVVNALQSASRTIEQDFGQSVATSGQQMTVARNNLLQFVGSADTVEGALNNLGNTAITLSENLDTVAQAGTVLGAVIAGRLVGRVATLAAGLTTATGAAAGLRTALAFMGGPLGLLVGAGGLLYAFREELGLVPPEAKSVAESVDEITGSLEGLSGAMLDTQIAAFGAELVQLQIQAQRTAERIERMKEQASSSYSYGQGQQGDISAGIAFAESEQASINNRIEAIGQAMDSLRELGETTGEAGDRASTSLDRLGETADAVVAKFRPMLNQEVEDILDRAGPGATIDAQGQIRDAWGNTLPTLQRQLEAELESQVNAFQTEQNLAAGLKSAAQAFIESAQTAANEAFASGLVPTGEQSSAPGVATLSSVIPTTQQESVPGLAKPSGQRHTVDIKVNGDSAGEVEADDGFAERLTNILERAAAGTSPR